MNNPWYDATLLMLEAHDVMRLRTVKIAGGGTEALAEVHFMIAEKVGAAVEAFGAIVSGGMPVLIIERLRDQVAANALRLIEEIAP